MDKVRKFDHKLKNIYADVFYGAKIGVYLMCGIGLLFLFIPFEMIGYKSITWFGVLICMSGVNMYMKSYFSVNEGGESVSIYQKLAFMPVTKSEIKKVRYGYLNHLCIRIGVIAFIIQEGMSLLSHSFGLDSILYVVVWAGTVWGISWLSLFLS